jgi:uncharacterized protein (TIGR04255 family)
MQFQPIQKFDVPHFGLFWARIRDQYPRTEIKPAIPDQTEQFGSIAAFTQQLGLELIDVPDLRCWYLDASGNRLVQVQRSRFVSNWRKLTGNEVYPRYPDLREQLQRQWGTFCSFLREEGLETPKVNQCEVTYVNHIEYGQGWRDFGEIDQVIAALATPKSSNRFLPEPERINMGVVYPLAENSGRLHVTFNPVFRRRDGKEVLKMALIARGAPKSSSDDDVFAWLDLGRRWVVRGFADFTTDAMHKVWGKQ